MKIFFQKIFEKPPHLSCLELSEDPGRELNVQSWPRASFRWNHGNPIRLYIVTLTTKIFELWEKNLKSLTHNFEALCLGDYRMWKYFRIPKNSAFDRQTSSFWYYFWESQTIQKKISGRNFWKNKTNTIPLKFWERNSESISKFSTLSDFRF